ncbi:MAG TPA: energy transducer TonB [Candidatus Solibacter sp.]|nr:energy transducer TonB [Candidatus Solibacter sp.]
MTTLVRKAVVAVLLISTVAVFPVRSSAQDSSDGPRKVIIKTPAVYPTLAQSMNIHGVVKLEAHVAPNGIVKSVDVKGGHPILTQAAVTAVGHWKFEPAVHETKEQIEVKFETQ